MKAVLFDLDGTLLDRDRSLKQFVEVQYDRLADDLGHVQKASYVARFIELDCRGQVWKDKVYQTLVEEFDLSGVTWQMLLEDYITEFQRHCIPFRGMVVMLNELKQRNYLLAVVTNGRSEFQRRSISGLGIQNDLDVVLVSEEEQIRKPQVEIFQRAVNRLAVRASESVFVGDNPEADITGAKNAGMKTIWKRNPYGSADRKADAVIDELDEIPHILELFDQKDPLS